MKYIMYSLKKQNYPLNIRSLYYHIDNYHLMNMVRPKMFFDYVFHWHYLAVEPNHISTYNEFHRRMPRRVTASAIMEALCIFPE